MIPALDYEFRIAVFAAGDGNTAPQFATHRVGEYVKRILHDKSRATPIVWRVLSTDDPADRSAATSLATSLNCDREIVAAGNVPEHRKREAVIARSELIVVPWSRRAATHSARVDAIVRAALRQDRLVLGVDGDNHDEIYQLVADHGTHGGVHETVVDRAPLRRPKISRGFVRISAFNRECNFAAAKFQEKLTEQNEKLRNAADAQGVPTEIIALLTENVVLLAVKADLVATDYGLRYRRIILWLHLLAFSSVMFAVLQLMFWPTAPWTSILEIAALLGVFFLLLIARKKHVHDRMMFTRYIAEQLRVAVPAMALGYDLAPVGGEHDFQRDYYWHADPRVSGSIQRFLRGVANSISEIRAQRSLAAPVDAPSNSPQAAQGAAFLKQSLLVPQQIWQSQTAARRHFAAQMFKGFTYALFVCALLFSTIHLVKGLAHTPPADGPILSDAERKAAVAAGKAKHSVAADDSPLWQFQHLLTVFTILIPAFAGALHGIGHYRDDERVATRAKHMAQRLSLLSEDAGACDSGASLRELVAATSRVMLAEVYDWLVDTSFRAPEPIV